ncbi:MAG: choice-of-anchor B family protein [Planctomycetes bacterium]|nr:choice-of-anchor B family protein [Planctomycetota bacterium]
MMPVATPTGACRRDAPAPHPVRSMRLAYALALVCLSLPASAQLVIENVTKLSQLDDHGDYNDVWGYVAPDGREYAIVGGQEGVLIVNASDPLAAYEVAWFPGVSCIWRDIKTWQQYVYVVNDCAGGVVVIDMSNPEAPVIVNEFGLSFLQHVHNVQIDTQTGKLYACGSAQGMVIYNLAANPVNPPKVTQWKGQGLSLVNGYVHDVHVYDGVAHAGLIYDGLYVLLDVDSLPAISVIGFKSSGADFTHSTWVDTQSQVTVVADETTGERNLALFDISTPSAPVLVSSLAQGGATVPHNPYIRGEQVHVAYYELGYVAYDISDPLAPLQIGRYDTTLDGPPQLLDGAWGCYPFSPSGFVYLSDIKNGFYLLKLNTPCPTDGSGRPSLCEVWPGKLPTTGQAAPKVLLSGGGLLGTTAVHVGPVTLGPGAFTVLDDQVLAFAMPALAQTGMVAITVENASGVSDPLYLPLQVPGGPELDSGASAVAVGGSITHVLDSDPGDLQFLAFSLAPVPSHASKVHFAIGDSFTSLFLLPALVAGPGGVTTLPGLQVPAAAAGLTVYWQFAAVGTPASYPADVSNVTISVIEP